MAAAVQAGAMYGKEWAGSRVCDAVLRRIHSDRARKALRNGGHFVGDLENDRIMKDSTVGNITFITAASRYV